MAEPRQHQELLPGDLERDPTRAGQLSPGDGAARPGEPQGGLAARRRRHASPLVPISVRRRVSERTRAPRHQRPEILSPQDLGAPQDHGLLQHLLQLADVPPPRRVRQSIEHVLRDRLDREPEGNCSATITSAL
jgi:hypothetical protein